MVISFFMNGKRFRLRCLAQGVKALLLSLMLVSTALTTRADSYPEYITDIIVVGGTASEADAAKSSYSDYTFINTDLNKGCGSKTDYVFIGYKKGSRANTNGGYITNIVITNQSDCPNDKVFNGKTYHCAPRDGGSWFKNSVYGDLNSGAGGWDIHVYYTKEEFSDHRVVSDISITTGQNSYTGGLRWNDSSTGDYADLNAGAGGDYIYMHLTTTTKTNRPPSDPTMYSGLVYTGTPRQLLNSNPNSYCTMWYKVDNGSWTSTKENVTATTAGNHTIYYYAASNGYGNQGATFSQTVNIVKSPNSGVTVSCPEVIEGTALSPTTGGTNLSTGSITYKYSTSQNGTYSTTAPTTAGTYWVKATVAGDDNCYEYTTAAKSFKILPDWALHNSGDSEGDAYVISTPQELDLLSQRVAAGNQYSGKYFRLGNNITYSYGSYWNNTSSTENNFTPIGNSNKSFKGNFDGKGYTVSGIRVSSSNHYCSLFGQISGSSVKNVILSDARFISSNSYCGGIVGFCNNSAVTNCWVKSNVCIGGRNYVGGIAGQFSGNTMSGCRSEAMLTTTGTGNRFGGIAGTLDDNGNIKHCIVDGATIPSVSSYYGAVVGNFWSGTLTNNYYANCTVAGVANATNVGYCIRDGVLADYDGARCAQSISAASGVTVAANGTTTTYNVSGITAYNGNNAISCGGKLYSGVSEQVNLTVNYSTTNEYYVLYGYTDGLGNALTKNDNGSYTLTMTTAAPTVTPDGIALWGVASGAEGTQAKPYLISSVADLNLLSEKVNAGKDFLGKYFRVTADIEYDGSVENNFTPIGFGGSAVFYGNFDGYGHCISGLNVKKPSDSYIGLFGNTQYGYIINTVLSNCTFNGANYVGGIVGKMTSGELKNCLVLGAKVTCPGTCGLIAGSFTGTLSNNFYDTQTSLNGMSGVNLGVNSSNNDNASLGVRIIEGENVSVTPAENVLSSYGNGTFKFYDSGLMYKNILYKDPNNYVTLNINYSGTIEQGYTLTGYKAYGTLISGGNGSYSVSLEATDCIIEAYIERQYWTGTGTEENPYVITDVEGMNHLAEEVNNGNTYENKHFALGADLEYDRSVENNFPVIGYNPKFFRGNLDGRGHTISGINVKRPADNSREVGIIGYSMGTYENRRYIRNLTVVNSSFVSTNRDNVGAICGDCDYTTIENCHVGSDVYVSGRDCVGGIAGNADKNILGCTSGATVVAQDGAHSAGGICGDNYGNVKDCIYYGDSVTAKYKGAIAGYMYKPYSPVVANSLYTPYGMGGVNSADTDGARFAVATKSTPTNRGNLVTTYGTDTYTGIKVYENALYYNGKYYWYDENLVVLGNESTDNAAKIDANKYSTVNELRNAVLADRTLYKDGKWNTICLPFSINLQDEECPLYGATARKLTGASVNGTTLTLTFGSAESSLQAGVPYLIKWAEGDDIVNPVFIERTVTAATATAQSYTSNGITVSFVGTYEPAALEANTTSNLYLGANNKLLYPTEAGYKVNACRAYFQISGMSAGAKAFGNILLNFDDESEATGIEVISDNSDYSENSDYSDNSDNWYTIDGRPLNGKPTTKGIYIHEGKKVMIEK